MHPVKEWRVEYTHEIEHAFSARNAGNEGMARVSARRAAGIIIREYLSRKGLTSQNNSAYKCLSVFISLPDVDNYYQDIANHFLLKVGTDHTFPEDIDLINDAQWLAENLLLENPS